MIQQRLKTDSDFLSVRCSKWVCSHFSVTFKILISTGMASKSCFIFPVKVYNLFTFLTCIRLEFHYAFLLVEALHSFSGNSQILLVFLLNSWLAVSLLCLPASCIFV